MNTFSAIKQLKFFSDSFRLGKSLEVTDDLINLLSEIVPQTIGRESNNQVSIEDIFSKILHCQKSEDWLGLADYLEYELSDFLADLF